MRVRLTEIRLRPTGKKVRLDRDLDVESLFIGRGPDNDLSLKGLTISLHQATLRMADDRLYVEAATGQEVNVNGLVTTGERLGPGDVMRIGPWELRVLEPEGEFDVAIEYEEIDRGKGERQALDERTRLGLETGLFAKRPLSWLGIVAVTLLFLLLPLAWSPAQSPWSTGEVSRGHAITENDCQACHSGFFRAVRNDDCLVCHHDIGRHTAPDVQMAELEDAACATCHLEHRGRDVELADLGSDFCSNCHADLASELPSTTLRNASDFADDHPPFKVALVVDAAARKVESIDWSDDLVERSGLEFNHLRHVGKAVSGRGDRKQYLDCGACHQPDAGGLYMKPIVFEEHCQDCHRLDFDATAPADFVPHGDPAIIRDRIRGFYAQRVVDGDIKDQSAPGRLRRRRPGSRLTKEEGELSRRWVESKLAAAERRFFQEPGTCELCHGLVAGGASDGGVGVEPVKLQTLWIPGSIFSHGSHASVQCRDCHPGASVFDPDPDTALARPAWSEEDAIPYGLVLREATTTVSESSGDILIPEIDVCRDCHAGAGGGGGDLVPSPCSMCHPFHVRAHGSMRKIVEAEISADDETGANAPEAPAGDDSASDVDSAARVHHAPADFAIRIRRD